MKVKIMQRYPAGLIENILQQYKGCTIAHRQLVTDICVIKIRIKTFHSSSVSFRFIYPISPGKKELPLFVHFVKLIV